MKYNEMHYSRFMEEIEDYIISLKDGIDENDGEKLTAEEWTEWIAKEATDKGESLDEEHIGWIVEKLEEDGYVKEKVWYAVQETTEDEYGTGSYDFEEV